MSRLLRAGAWAAIVALAASNILLALTPLDVSIPANVGADRANKSLTPLIVRPSAGGVELSELAEVRQRPLFSQSRRPHVAAPEQQAAAITRAATRTNPDELRLAGVIRFQARRRALIEWSGNPDGVWVDEGAVHAGWRVARINDAEVRLEAGGQVHHLSLRQP
jgi:hypothetical protein